jgi:hypothetical protein
MVTVANPKRWNQLRVGVDDAERPHVAKLGIIVFAHMAVFLADESPYLVHFQTSAGQVAHFRIHEGRAALPDTDAETHDRIPVDAGNPLDTANRGTFGKCRDYRDLFVGIE